MKSLGNAVTQPFQGDRAGENTLALAAALAPRLNFGRNPLQQGEGEGLRNVLAGMSAMAGQRRKSAAESQVLAGLPDILAGRSEASSLPLGDLSPEIGKLFFDAVLKNEERRNPTIENRLAAMSHASAIRAAGGDPLEDFQRMGMGSFFPGGSNAPAPPPPVRSPGVVGMLPAEALAPSLLNLPPTRTSRPFGYSRVEEDYMKPSSTPEQVIGKSDMTPQEKIQQMLAAKEDPANLQAALGKALGDFNSMHRSVFGGQDAAGNFIMAKKEEPTDADYHNLLTYANQAQTLQDNVDARRGGKPSPRMFQGLLPDEGEMLRIRTGLKMQTGLPATLSEVMDEWIRTIRRRRKEEIGRGKSASGTAVTPPATSRGQQPGER